MRGFSFLEVLVSLTIISAMMLSFLQLQLNMITRLQDVYYYNLAINQLWSLSERLQVNHDEYHRSQEIVEWNAENRTLLPHGHGNLHCNQYDCEIIIKWGIKREKNLSLRVSI
jgi:prepilin-type N-terminal cleavage/methylation domain-containing protein